MIALVLLLAAPTQVPANWDCAPEAFGDGICDCGCDAPDDDCDTAEFTACVTDGCPPGDVPWEHQNDQCMSSTCGDGWKADDEACDELDTDGCNANCSAVNAGFTCGEAASGCAAIGEGEGEGEGDEGEGEGEGEDSDDGGNTGGCAGASSGLAMALVPLLRRRR